MSLLSDCNVSNTANCTDDLSKIENNTKHHSDSLSSKPLTPLISNSKQPEKEPECEKTKEGPAVKPPPVSKMRKILQDPTFKLDELVNEENSRTGDETIDLTVHANQPTFQLVAWIRFHRTYHAGKMHVRFLTRQNVPVILIMPPNNIVASGISRDIKDLTKETSVPKVVKDLLNPSVPPQETSLYAVLFCDGFKWELVGSICYRTSSMQATSKASQIQTQTSRETDSVTLQEGSTPASNHLTPVPPNVSSEKPLPDPPSMNSCDVPDPATTTEASSQDQPKNSSNTGSSLNNIENGSTSTVETLLPTEDLAAPASSEVSGLQAPVGSCPPADLKTSPSLSSQNILGIRIKTENIEPEEYPEELYDSDDFYDSDDTDDMEDFESVENISETRKKEWELSDDDVEEDFENLDPEALEKRQREIEEKLARLNSKLSLNLSKVGAHDQGGTPSSIVDENSTIGSQDQSPSSSSSKCPSIATTSAITEMTQPPLKSQPEQKIAAPLSSTNGCQTQTVNLNLTEDSLPSAPDTMLAKYPPGSCDSVLGKETRAHSSKSPERQSSTVELCPRLSSPSRECFVSNLPDETDKGNGSALDTSQPRNTSMFHGLYI